MTVIIMACGDTRLWIGRPVLSRAAVLFLTTEGLFVAGLRAYWLQTLSIQFSHP
jgi:hypothetical protein